MVIIELFNTGLFYMFICFSEPYVWIPAYFCLLFGLITQFVLLKKCHKKFWNKLVFMIGFIGVVICECIWHSVTGWGKLIVTMVCLLFTTLLFGAVIASIISFMKSKKNIIRKRCSNAIM